MEVSNQPKLKFHGVDIVNIQFNSMKQYDGKTGIDFHVEPTVFYPDNNELFFRIIMQISLVCNGYFDLKMVGLGNFELDKALDDKTLKKTFVNANAPAIMFPYVRSFITTLTSNLGGVTGSLVIPTQFFHGELPEVTMNDEDLEQDGQACD